MVTLYGGKNDSGSEDRSISFSLWDTPHFPNSHVDGWGPMVKFWQTGWSRAESKPFLVTIDPALQELRVRTHKGRGLWNPKSPHGKRRATTQQLGEKGCSHQALVHALLPTASETFPWEQGPRVSAGRGYSLSPGAEQRWPQTSHLQFRPATRE